MKCAQCKHRKCYRKAQNCTKITLEENKAAYTEDKLALMQASACTEGRFYGNLTRLEETAEFCKFMGYKKIGIAFCVGLGQEAALIAEYLGKFFEVHSVCCKVCGVDKKEFELEQIKADDREVMCNPIMQAKVLNNDGAEFCVTVGLCV